MKDHQFKLFQKLLDEIKPTSIAEIGVHKGITASQMCEYVLLTTNNNLTYTGYDAFDLVSQEQQIIEVNGKGPANLNAAHRHIGKMVKRYSNRFTYEFKIGWTTDTLTSPVLFDFIYIDGGHSYESVSHDWSMVKKSKMIVFDDYGMPGVNKLMREIENSGTKIEYIENTDVSRAVAIIRNYV
jgi:predicted O-methyltransferase YrrM